MDWETLPGELIEYILSFVEIEDSTNEAALQILQTCLLLNRHWRQHVRSTTLFSYGELSKKHDGKSWREMVYSEIRRDDVEQVEALLAMREVQARHFFSSQSQYEDDLKFMLQCGAAHILQWSHSLLQKEAWMSEQLFVNIDFVEQIRDAAVLRWYLHTFSFSAQFLCLVHALLCSGCCFRLIEKENCGSRDQALLQQLLSELPFPLTAHQSLCCHLCYGIHQTRQQRVDTLSSFCAYLLHAKDRIPTYCYYHHDTRNYPTLPDYEARIQFRVPSTSCDYFTLPDYPKVDIAHTLWKTDHTILTSRYSVIQNLGCFPALRELWLDALEQHGYYLKCVSWRSLRSALLYFYRESPFWISVLLCSLFLSSLYCFERSDLFFLLLSLFLLYITVSALLYGFQARPMQRLEYSARYG